MRRLNKKFACAILTVAAVSCAKDYPLPEGASFLELGNVSVGSRLLTKSVIDGPDFPLSEAEKGLGLFLLGPDGKDYDGQGKSVSNIRYYDNGHGWKAGTPIMLSATKGILYGYFPYNKDIEDLEAIPVESSIDGTDYMYVAPVEGVNAANRYADIALRHALARISVNFVKENSYPGEGRITSLSLSGEAVAASGTLNAVDGSVTAVKGNVSFEVAGDIITEEGTAEECLIVPADNSGTGSRVELSCVIDGRTYNLSVDDCVVKSGTNSLITVLVSDIGLCVARTGEQDWDEGIVLETPDGKKVKVAFSPDIYDNDIMMNAVLDGNSVIINAYSLFGNPVLCDIPEDKCSMSVSPLVVNRPRVMKITDIQDDITVYLDYDLVAMVRKDVPNTAFYKDLFMEAGLKLDRCSGAPKAVRNMYGTKSLTDDANWEFMEFLSLSDSAKYIGLQNSILSGCETDLNGVLLYPDGEPRFKMMYGYGGKASAHAETLGQTGCDNVNLFYARGGSYASSCASTNLSTKIYGSSPQKLSYDLLDGGACVFSGMYIAADPYYNDLKLESNSAFKAEFFPGTEMIDSVRHNGGPMLKESMAPAGTEIIARYNTRPYPAPTNPVFEEWSFTHCLNQPCLWAYKRSDESGRLVCCGSHPEVCNTATTTYLFESILRYAMEGVGCATVKAKLENGKKRVMDLHQGDPSHCGIGDHQCHHFAILLPRPVARLKLTLEWDAKTSLDLALKHESFAFLDADPDYKVESSHETSFISSPIEITANDIPAGMWYVTVRCTSGPEARRVTDGTQTYFKYTGTDAEMSTLNGVPYSIRADWTYKD